MGKWIFQDIENISIEYYDKAKKIGLEPAWQWFNSELRAKIDPEIYLQYLVWQFDIYIDMAQIYYRFIEVYPETLSAKDIAERVWQQKSDAQYIINEIY